MYSQLILLAFCLGADAATIVNFSGLQMPCESGWTFFCGSQKCYKITSQRGSWTQISQACKADGGSLVSIHSKAENDFLTKWAQDEIQKSNIISVSNNGLWLGFKALGGWEDESRFDFVNWNTISFEKFGAEVAVLNLYDQKGWTPGDWYARSDARENNPGICQKSAQPSPSPIAQPVGSCLKSAKKADKIPEQCFHACDSGWTYFNDTDACYKVFGDKRRNGIEAESLCNTFGAHLASIHCDKENAFLVEFSRTGLLDKNTGLDEVWIGLRLASGGNDNYDWTDGTLLQDGSGSEYTNWASDHSAVWNTWTNQLGCGYLSADIISGWEFSHQKWRINKCEDPLRALVCKKSLSDSNLVCNDGNC